jgi:hypothetical protein
MALPSTKPLDGEFWYVLDDKNDIVWRPRPKLRGDFYLGWLGQNKNVVGAGLVQIEQGQLTHICTHGTPYYWLQPYKVLPFTCEVLRTHGVLGADTMAVDYSLAGWQLRDQTSPPRRKLSDDPVSEELLESLARQAVDIIVRNFRSEGEPPPAPEVSGLLARTAQTQSADPIEELLNRLTNNLGDMNVVPVLIELVKHDINVMPGFRQSDFFENLSTTQDFPAPSKVAGLILSAVYHLAPLLDSRRLEGVLLLNSLRQRHPFDVTWGADLLAKCFGMSAFVRLLQAALRQEQSDQMRGNVLDLLQELGYGVSAGLGSEVLKGLGELQSRESLGAFDQVVASHSAFIQEYLHDRDAAAQQPGQA